MKPREIPSQVNDLFVYDEVDGHLRTKSGEIAGTLFDGYRRVQIGPKSYLAHRIVWFMATGEQPPEKLDHVDMNRSNNRMSNLRAVTHAENMRNCKARGSVGLKGVTPKRNKFRAQITVDRKTLILGVFSTPEEAHQAYCNEARRRFGESVRVA